MPSKNCYDSFSFKPDLKKYRKEYEHKNNENEILNDEKIKKSKKVQAKLYMQLMYTDYDSLKFIFSKNNELKYAKI